MADFEMIATTKCFLGACSEKTYLQKWVPVVLEPISKLYSTCLPGQCIFHPRVQKEFGSEIAQLLILLCNLWFGVNSVLKE